MPRPYAPPTVSRPSRGPVHSYFDSPVPYHASTGSFPHGGVPHTPASCKRRPHNASSFHSSCTHDLNIHPLPWWSSCITNGQARAGPHRRLISLATEAAPPGAQTSCQLAHRVLARVQTGLPGWPVRHLSIPRAKGCAPAPCMHAGRELCGKRSQLPPSGFASPPCFQRPPRPACT